MRGMRRIGFFSIILLISVAIHADAQAPAGLSPETEACIACHQSVTPGIVADWSRSRMGRTSPREALSKPPMNRRMSADKAPLPETVVGCAECHMLNPDTHRDTFEHQGFRVHTVVTPGDCAVCHPVERDQFDHNLMSRAYGNLMENPVYLSLVTAINGSMTLTDRQLRHVTPDDMTNADACLRCHGTKLTVEEKPVTRDTAMGEMDFPVIQGWPNRGSGRLNPDDTRGNCAACHSRHRFSIEMARKPDTCSECHKGPDVPAYKVYDVSKHGNIYRSLSVSDGWDFNAVPWTVGEDFAAPTCASCHVSMIASPEGEILAERTHRMNDRLAWRIFGLPYAHPHPKSPDTTFIRNKDGLALPTAFDGTPAATFLISKDEMAKRNRIMKGVCGACHSTGWTDGHFRRFEQTIETTNANTLAATQILMRGWEEGIIPGPAAGDSPFNDPLERKWVEQWLFFANSTRYASAMMGADYGVFANGRWYMSKNAHEMLESLKIKAGLPPEGE